ncbi:hypothetical protein [Nonomuraea sp. NPDC050786]|uniref:hypothetical protein n=1 Tax=Nonomuraea sp. NPDC050786 TaxID=3154840 RepID=UPI0033E6749D
MTVLVEIDQWGEIIACICGNAPHKEGFYPCTPWGWETNLTYNNRLWRGHYRCASCGLTIRA